MARGNLDTKLGRALPVVVGVAVVGLCTAVLIVLPDAAAAIALAALASLFTLLLVLAQRRRNNDAAALRLAAVLESSGDAIVSTDARGRFTSWSAGATRMLGYTREEVIGQSVFLVIPDDERPEYLARLPKTAAGETLFGWKGKRRHKDGHDLDVELTVSPLKDDKGHVTGAVVVARDMTERVEAARALAESEQRFRRSFEDSGIGMALVLPYGKAEEMLEANEAMAALTGYSIEQLKRIGPLRLLHPDDFDQELREEFFALGRGELPVVRREVRLVHAEGDIVWVVMTVSLVRGPEGEPIHAVVQVQDVSERKRFEGQLQYLADHDTLTGLFNRRRFESELQREVATARRYGTGGAVLVIDLDHFKYVNDTLGHAAGDELITIIGDVLRRRLRHSDLVGRMGGDEFAVILPRSDEEEARRTGESLLREVRADMRAANVSGAKHVTASVGVALFGRPRPELSAEELLAEADIAMYDAKEAGRDRLAVYDAQASRHERMRTSLAWVHQIESALETNRFVLHAQPILSVGGGRERRYELLVRMIAENGELVPPATFLDVAERNGLAARLDQWVVSNAVDLLAEQQRLAHDVRFEVNLSATSVTDPAMLEYIGETIAASGVDPGRLIFEITETAAIVNVGQAKAFVQGLRDIGCEFAIDDFGAGFASFYYLKHLDFDYLKIDGEFITDLATSETNQLVVRSVADIARGLGQRTIAEFVDQPATLELLYEYGVDYAQGFHTGRPLAIAEIDFAAEVPSVGGRRFTP